MSPRTAAAALLLSAGAAALGGCGGGAARARSAGLRLQREDLVAVVRALQAAQGEAAAQTAAAKAAWRLVANGLPAQLDAIPPTITRVRVRAVALRLPALFGETRARGLTGPGSALAGEYRSFVALAGTGWRQIEFALGRIRSGPPRAASFARANVALYIESVYDAHFTLAQMGKQLTRGYTQLGGGRAFGRSLTQAEVEALASAFSEARYRLHPHVGVRLGA